MPTGAAPWLKAFDAGAAPPPLTGGNGEALACAAAGAGRELLTGGKGDAAAFAGLAAAGLLFTGGNGEESLAGAADWFGKGAGNAPCAWAGIAPAMTSDNARMAADGATRRWIVTISPTGEADDA